MIIKLSTMAQKNRTQKAPDALTQKALDAFLQGDRKAFDTIYQAYKEIIYSYCYKILQNKAEAEDCTAETFLALWERVKPFNDTDHIDNFLFRVARNKSLNLVRQHKTRNTRPLGESDDIQDRLESYVNAKLCLEQVWIEKEKLPPRPGEVLRLLYKHMSIKEIAAYLRISRNTVDQHIKRARDALKGVRKKK